MRYGGTTEIQCLSRAVKHHLHDIGVFDFFRRIDRPAQRGDISRRIFGQQACYLLKAGCRHGRLIALQVHDQLIIVPAQLAGAFGDPVAAARMLRGGHHAFAAEALHGRKNPFIIRRHDDRCCLGLARRPPDVLEQRLARQVQQQLAGQTF